MISSLLDLPITGAYLTRIGAEPIHFWLARKSEMVNGYPKVIGSVKFHEDGNTKTWGALDKPTEAEAEGIRAEFAAADFPKIVPLTAIGEAPPGIANLNDPNIFICHDFDGNIIMVHQRYENQDGSKGFLPWTYWSDGQWRRMEPDVMPFYGLKGANEHSTLFIHEGSKAARRVRDMLNGDVPVNRFPWLEEMRWGAHIGWIGGVHALHRSDWPKLGKMNWKRVIVVADNDAGGRAIVPEIAKHFHCATFVLAFTNDWPETFDCADPFPETMFGDEGQYTGPPFNQCLQPATWATDEEEYLDEAGKVKIRHVIRSNFAEQWAWVEKQDMMVNLDMPAYKMPSAHFNSFIRPFSHIKNTLDIFQRHYSGNQMELTYDPSSTGSIVRTAEGLQAINLYEAGPIRPAPGDWTPWLDYLEHMFPVEEDRAQVKRWCATLIARPATRMIYGLLLMSESQGVGKGTFARILADLVGRANASFPSANMIVESPFNGWISGKRLIIVDEIYEGHSWKAYNKLKPYVTDETIEVNVKHIATWSMPNWTHYVLMSNSRAALKLEAKDRRWLVPEVTEAVWEEERFAAFYLWLRSGGLSAISMWAKTFVERGEGRYVRPGEIAPSSANKRRLISESKSEAETALEALAEAMIERGEPTAIPLSMVKPWLKARTDNVVYETAQSLSRLLQGKGLFVTDRIKIGGDKVVLVVNQHPMLEWENAKLRSAVTDPGSLFEAPM